MHHFFKESHLEHTCPICRKPHGGKWKPEFWHFSHYKTLECMHCTHKVFLKTDKHSSGHY